MPLQHGNNQSQERTTNSKSRIIDIKNQPSVQNSSINFRTSTNSSYFKKINGTKTWQLATRILHSEQSWTPWPVKKEKKRKKERGKKNVDHVRRISSVFHLTQSTLRLLFLLSFLPSLNEFQPRRTSGRHEIAKKSQEKAKRKALLAGEDRHYRRGHSRGRYY